MNRWVLYFFCGILSVSCASLHTKGKKYLAEENYNEAIFVFSSLLEKDSEDQKATIGLKKSKIGWIQSKLIEVRMLRLSGNHVESLKLLKKIIRKQNKWSLFPSGAVAFTQKEELYFAQKRVFFLLNNALRKKSALKAHRILKQSSGYFLSDKSQRLLSQLRMKIKQTATIKCNKMRDRLRSHQYFYGSFVNQYCSLWGLPSINLTKQELRMRNSQYSQIKVETKDNIEALPQEYILDIEKKLNIQLEKTPWYNPRSSRIATVSLQGHFLYEHTKENVDLQHSYSVRVPYESTMTLSKEQHENPSDLTQAVQLVGGILSIVSGTYRPRRTTDNGDGTVTVSTTNYRDEPRTLKYPATKHYEFFKSRLALSGSINNNPLVIVRNEEEEKKSISHSNKMPHAGLFPKAENIVGPETWIENERHLLANSFFKELKTSWSKKHCSPASVSPTNKQDPEDLFRCLKISNEMLPDHQNNYLRNRFALSRNQLVKILPEISDTIVEIGIN